MVKKIIFIGDLHIGQIVFFFSNRKKLSGKIMCLFLRPRKRDSDKELYQIEVESFDDTYLLNLKDIKGVQP